MTWPRRGGWPAKSPSCIAAGCWNTPRRRISSPRPGRPRRRPSCAANCWPDPRLGILPATERGSAMRLQDKVVVITGAGAGIGRATALLCAEEGATVACLDRDPAAAEAVAAALARPGMAIAADVGAEAEVAAAM